MQIGNCLLVLNEFKSSVVKKNVTPAEVQFLVLAHSDNAREIAVRDLVITGEVKRTSAEERNRLSKDYIRRHGDPKRVTIESIWPQVNSRLPERFDEVVDQQGAPLYQADGKSLKAPPTGETMTIGGKVFTKAELEKLVGSHIKQKEVEIEEVPEDGETILTPAAK